MQGNTNIKPDYWPTVIIGGIVLFSILYLIAANFYPGGSNKNPYQQGFSWSSNYWCELLSRNAKNGRINVARPIALVGMVIGAISISAFWIYISKNISMKIWISRILQISGVISMFCSIFLYSYYHDLAIHLAVTFVTIAFIITLSLLSRLDYNFHRKPLLLLVYSVFYYFSI